MTRWRGKNTDVPKLALRTTGSNTGKEEPVSLVDQCLRSGADLSRAALGRPARLTEQPPLRRGRAGTSSRQSPRLPWKS